MILVKTRSFGTGHRWVHFHTFPGATCISELPGGMTSTRQLPPDPSMLEASQKFTDQVEGNLKAEGLEVTSKLVNISLPENPDRLD